MFSESLCVYLKHNSFSLYYTQQYIMTSVILSNFLSFNVLQDIKIIL